MRAPLALAAAAVLGSATYVYGADEVAPPLGSWEYLPSADHPVGLLGDGTGLFPGASGIATQWDARTGKNIIWKTEMPSWSNASPIVVGDWVFVCSEPDELVCVDAASGEILWRKVVNPVAESVGANGESFRQACRDYIESGMKGKEHGTWKGVFTAMSKQYPGNKRLREYAASFEKPFEMPPASAELIRRHITGGRAPEAIGHFGHYGFTMPTPVSDGKHVWVKNGLGGVACFDLDGNRRWMKSFSIRWGYCSLACSPILVGDRLVFTDNSGKVHRALEKVTGRELWVSEVVGNWNGWGAGSPCAVRLPGKDLIVAQGGEVLDADTGKVVGSIPMYRRWSSDKLTRATNVPMGDTVYYTGERVVGAARLEWLSGGLKATALWHCRGPDWNSPVCFQGVVYFAQGGKDSLRMVAPGGGGERKAVDLAKLTSDRFASVKAAGAGKNWWYGQPAVAGGCFFMGSDLDGVVVVKLAGEASRLVASNPTGMHVRANPFFQGDRMYVRAYHHLYSIGDPGRAYRSPGGSGAARGGIAKAAPASTKTRRAAVRRVAPRIDRKALLARLVEAVGKGGKPRFRLSSMRASVTVLAATPDGKLRLSARGMRMTYDFARLSQKDLTSLAAALDGP